MESLEYVRKQDFKIAFTVPMMDGELVQDYDRSMEDLVNAVYVVRTSFVEPHLFIEVRQPIFGDIANSVIRICKYGLDACRLRTVFPDRPDLIDNENCSHIVYDYRQGRCIQQETVMARDIIMGDQMLIHSLMLRFEKFRVDTNVLDKSLGNARSVLSLVPNTGTEREPHRSISWNQRVNC